MITNIKQKLIKFFKDAEGGKPDKLAESIRQLEQKKIVFPNNEDGVDRACLIAASILSKHIPFLFKDKEQADVDKIVKEFSKSLGLSPELEFNQKANNRPRKK